MGGGSSFTSWSTTARGEQGDGAADRVPPVTRAVPHLLLVGLGHAHLFVLEALARVQHDRLRTTLVTPDAYHYSGMVPGTVAGDYRPAQSQFRPAYLARAAEAVWIDAQVLRIDHRQRHVQLTDGSSAAYDLVSFDIGSRLAADYLPGVSRHAIPVKPVSTALRVLAASAEAVEQARPTTPAQIVIVGGGAAGTEMAFCLDAALARRYARSRYHVTLLEAGAHLLGSYAERFRDKVLTVLQQRGVEVRTNVTVAAVEPAEIIVQAGLPIRYDVLLWATGPRAPALFRDSGLPVDQFGYLRVTPTLQVEELPMIFGSGDCVSITGYPWIPRAGVYAVREGPVLARNIHAYVRGEALTAYQPQRRWLSLMNTGEKRALLSYKGVVTHGRLAWWLKNSIDRRFMRRFQQLEQAGRRIP